MYHSRSVAASVQRWRVATPHRFVGQGKGDGKVQDGGKGDGKACCAFRAAHTRSAEPPRSSAPVAAMRIVGAPHAPSIGPHVRYWAFRGRWRCQFSGRQTAPNIGPRVLLDVMRLSILGRTAPHVGPQVLGASDDPKDWAEHPVIGCSVVSVAAGM